MKTVWEKLTDKQLQELHTFNDGYREFLSINKTEREFTSSSVQLAEKYGFKDLNTVETIQPGDKLYATNKNKNIVLFTIGKEDIRQGMNILGAHIDSPRMDLKQHPLYEKEGVALLDTHYYGGIKKYQWTARPLALHGVVCKKDGTTINVVFGENENEPVLGITELLIHLSAEQLQKTASKVVEGENLDLLVGSIPDTSADKDPIKANILKLLKEKYDIDEDDFMSAELEVVPAGKMLNYGLDNSMLMGYGHDDKVCAYTSLMALLDTPKVERTSCCILVDKEEIGSVGATGMHSKFFEHTVAKILAKMNLNTIVDLNDTLENSKMLSSDVSAAMDPLYTNAFDSKNAAYLGAGICFNKYTGSRGKSGSNDANAEYFASIRNVMDKNDITFQTCELGAVDVGGGGTIAYILAEHNMEVVDAGIAVQNMHSPCEVVSKADVYEAYRAYIAFLQDMK